MIVVLLGVFLALGMSLSVVQAGGMAAKMALAAGMADSGTGTCSTCGGGGDDTGSVACTATCTAGHGPAVVSSGSLPVGHDASAAPFPQERSLRGRCSSPEPYPPRSFVLG